MTDSPPVPQRRCDDCYGDGRWEEEGCDGYDMVTCMFCAGTGEAPAPAGEEEEMFRRKNKDPGFRRRFDEATGEFVIEREDVNGWIEVDRYRLSPAPAGEENDHAG